jgi:signal transduction histidine kinase
MHVRAGMVSGADDYLTKPIGNDALISAIEARLARREASRLEAERRIDEMRRSVAVLLPHELRTPLTTILGGSQFIDQFHREMSPEAIGDMAHSIFKAAQRLHRLAENYILYAQLEVQRVSGAGAPPPPLAGSTGGDEAGEAARETATEWGRAADLRLEIEDAQVPLAPLYLRKLAAELVDNALKFSERGTAVTVSLRSAPGEVTLEVTDAGRGMTKDEVRAIGAFRQFDRAFFEQQGSGLGFALVRGIASGSGGHFDLDSRPGAGTRVRIRWPA